MTFSIEDLQEAADRGSWLREQSSGTWLLVIDALEFYDTKKDIQRVMQALIDQNPVLAAMILQEVMNKFPHEWTRR